jgi:hypothetical protein
MVLVASLTEAVAACAWQETKRENNSDGILMDFNTSSTVVDQLYSELWSYEIDTVDAAENSRCDGRSERESMARRSAIVAAATIDRSAVAAE